MRTRHFILLLAYFCFLLGCKHLTNNYQYPYLVSKHDVKDHYDNARWFLYLYYIEETCRLWNKNNIFYNKDEIGLEIAPMVINHDIVLDTLVIKGDNVEFAFSVQILDSISCSIVHSDEWVATESIIKTVTVSIKNKQIVQASNMDLIFVNGWWMSNKSRHEKNIALKQKLKRNKDYVNPWLLKEAKRRGLL